MQVMWQYCMVVTCLASLTNDFPHTITHTGQTKHKNKRSSPDEKILFSFNLENLVIVVEGASRQL